MCEVQVTATEALRLASAVVRVAWQAESLGGNLAGCCVLAGPTTKGRSGSGGSGIGALPLWS